MTLNALPFASDLIPEAPKARPLIPEKPKRSFRLPPGLLKVFAFVLGALVLLVGLYYLSAALVNGQIKSNYTDKDCPAALKWARPAKNLYPQALAPFMKTARLQAAECQVYVDAQALQAEKQWEQAYQRYGDYLSTYPAGPFLSEARDGSAQSLLGWAQEQYAARQYEAAAGHLTTLLADFGETPAAPEAGSLLPSVYMDWGQSLRNDEKYEQAVDVFVNLRDWNAKHAVEEVKSARLELATTYLEWARALFAEKQFSQAFEKLSRATSEDPNPTLSASPGGQAASLRASYQKAWGDALAGEGKYADAIEHYDSAIRLASQQEMGGLEAAKFEATLKWAEALSEDDKFADALIQVDRARDLADTEAEQGRVEDARQAAYLAFSKSDGAEAMDVMTNQAYSLCNDGKVVPFTPPILALNPDKKGVYAFNTGDYSPGPVITSFSPETPGEMHYVACITQETRTVQTCPYTGGYYIRREREYWLVKLYDAVTGQLKTRKDIAGEAPSTCSYQEMFTIGVFTKVYSGFAPTDSDLEAWLKEYIK